MKHITLCFVALLSCLTTLTAQVKKTYKDQNHQHQTVVIKTSDSDNDLDILDAQFNIDNFKVGEVVKITTEKRLQIDKSRAKSKLQNNKRSAKLNKNNDASTAFKGRSLGGKRKDKKPKLAYNNPPKKKKGKDYSKKCYKF